MTEYGVFNDEGCIESGLTTLAEAESRAAEYRIEWANDSGSPIVTTVEGGDPYATAHEICPDHEEQARDTCEECFAEEGEDEADDEGEA